MDGKKVTEVAVEKGSNKILTIIADEGYRIISVKVNDVEAQLNNGLLELKDIQQDQNILVQTEKIEDETNNEENKIQTDNITEGNTTIDNEIVEENITTDNEIIENNNTSTEQTEEIQKNKDKEAIENKNEVSKNNPPTGDICVLCCFCDIYNSSCCYFKKVFEHYIKM